MLKICALGELLIDFSQVGTNDKFPSYKALPGGAPSNFLAAGTMNGACCSFIGKVGDDEFGHKLDMIMQEYNIDTAGLIFDKDVFTSLAFVSLDSVGERSFSFSRKPGADTMLNSDEINYSLIDGCDIFHFGTLSLTNEPSYSATLSALEYARKKGKIITFDPNYRAPLWDKVVDAICAAKLGFSYADIVKISEEEALFYFGKDIEQSAEILIKEFGVKLVAITLGINGVFCRTSSFNVSLNGIENNDTVDTTGAGDIWFGYFITSLFNDKNLSFTEENVLSACKVANAAASLSTTSFGGISSVPSYAEVIDYIKKYENI